MRIAIITTPENPVPPQAYGGAERVADVMVHQLKQRGHTVHLFAAQGSTSPADTLISPLVNTMGSERQLAVELKKRDANHRYDCVIDYAAIHIMGQSWQQRVISLMGGDPYRKYSHNEVHNRVYVSKEFATFNECPDYPVLRNPVCPDPLSVRLGEGNEQNVLYVGLVHEMKGIHIAAAAC